jgi:beta-1,4-N-acetylglucosaminyltransferase
MIFVTVGMHYQGFERLLKKMDEISGRIEEEVIMQTGATPYRPKHATSFAFVEDDEEMMDLYRAARVIVCHAGAGTLLTALKLRKPLVTVPRLKEFNEHVDDQQRELAEALAQSGRAIAVYDVDELEGVLAGALEAGPARPDSGGMLTAYLQSTIRGLKE